MTEKDLIKKDDALCLLEDDKKCFLIDKDGRYLTAERMLELAEKMQSTAQNFGKAIEQYNKSKKREGK